MKITEIIEKYTNGEASLEATNAALKEAGAGFHLDPERNVIREGERDHFGLLDTGTGTLDKVEIDVETMTLKHDDVGEMKALCIFNGTTYQVKGNKLEELEA